MAGLFATVGNSVFGHSHDFGDRAKQPSAGFPSMSNKITNRDFDKIAEKVSIGIADVRFLELRSISLPREFLTRLPIRFLLELQIMYGFW